LRLQIEQNENAWPNAENQAEQWKMRGLIRPAATIALLDVDNKFFD
jgi:hypothetical protein